MSLSSIQKIQFGNDWIMTVFLVIENTTADMDLFITYPLVREEYWSNERIEQ